MTPRNPQLPLRLEADTPDDEAGWRAGGVIIYLGGALTLILDTSCREPTRMAHELHLPLPPAASPRQICDAAESWLRDEALRTFTTIVTQKSALAGWRPGTVALAFGKRSDWARIDGNALRCHWRLIEQEIAVIEQVLSRALANLQPAPVCNDLFALV